MLPIYGPRIQIRPLRTDDLRDFLRYRSQPEAYHWQGVGPFDEVSARQFLRKHHSLNFRTTGVWQQLGIEWKKQSRLIGDCAVKFASEERRHAELGITVSPDYHGRGIGQEAMHLLIRLLFDFGELHKVFALIDARNAASIRLIEKMGFQLEGRLRNHFWNAIDDCWDDELFYGLLADEWKVKLSG